MQTAHPQPRLVLVAVLAALALALLAAVPATLDDLSFNLGAGERGAPAQNAPGPATSPAEPFWQDNPLTWPLLQAPAK
jgi:hypothetical protein